MKLSSVLTIALSLALCAGVARAGDSTLTVGSGSGFGGTSVDVDVTLDTGLTLQGWSWGICNDPAVAMVSGVVDGATTAAFLGGDGPDFNQTNLLADGWTIGVVISFLGMETLPPGSGYQLNTATYMLVGADDSTTALTFCDTLGTPPVASVIVSGGASLTPAFVNGSLTVDPVPPSPLFTYTAGDATVTYNPGDGTNSGPISVNSSITQNSENPSLPFPADTQGFSMGCGNDPAYLTPTGISSTGELASIASGAGPDFFGDGLFADGWTVGVVYAFLGGVFIQFDVEKDVIAVDYDVAIDLTGDVDGDSTSLDWTDSLGTPAVANVVVVGGASYSVLPLGAVSGTVTFNPVVDIPFIRGDCNEDGIVNIADGIYILNDLFQSGPEGGCAEACDVNDDGLFDQSDAVYVFNYRFLGGPAPAAPFPGCGTEADAPCDSHGPCE